MATYNVSTLGPDLAVVNPAVKFFESNAWPVVAITLLNVVVGSAYYVSKISDGTLLGSGTAGSSTIAIPYNFFGNVDVCIRVRKGTSGAKYIPFEIQGTITNDGLTSWIAQVADTIA
jgi:hypothetical protein